MAAERSRSGISRTRIVMGLVVYSIAFNNASSEGSERTNGMTSLPSAAAVSTRVETASAVASPAQSFVNSIGVNTHITYANRGYRNLPLIIRSLRFLGVRHVRDRAPMIPDLPAYRALSAAGATFDLVITGRGGDLSVELPKEIDATKMLMLGSPGSVFSIEGPNETNTETFLYQGRSSVHPPVATRTMQTLSKTIRSDPYLKRVSLVSLSISNGVADWPTYQDRLGDLSPYVDRANWHVYFDKGSQPGPAVASMYHDAQRTAPNKPVVFTELGYFTGRRYSSGAGVGELAQAKNSLNGLLDAFKMGVSHTYLYELTEGSAHPSETDFEQTFGLFRADGTPKLAAVAIHNFSAILSRPEPRGDTGAPTALSYTIDGLPAEGNSLLLRQGPDAFYLVVWNEAADWDAEKHKDVEVNPTRATVQFTTSGYNADVYDPLRGAEPMDRLSDVRSVSLALTDHPLIIRVTSGLGGR